MEDVLEKHGYSGSPERQAADRSRQPSPPATSDIFLIAHTQQAIAKSEQQHQQYQLPQPVRPSVFSPGKRLTYNSTAWNAGIINSACAK